MRQLLPLQQRRWHTLLPARRKRPQLQPMPLGGPQCCLHRHRQLSTDCTAMLLALWPVGNEHQWLAASGAAPRDSASGWVMRGRLAHRGAQAHGHRAMPARRFAGPQCVPWPRQQRRCDEWCLS